MIAAVPVFFLLLLLLSRYLATNSGYREYFTTMEGGTRKSDKGAGKNSDALPSEGKNSDALLSEGDSADIHVDKACTLECL